MSSDQLGTLDELADRLDRLSVRSRRDMDASQLQSLLDTAISRATEQAKRVFQGQIDDLTNRLASLEAPARVEEYREVQIRSGVECNESLEIIKSLPEFDGNAAKYVSWRQAATTAHKLFEKFDGSSRYYQAIAIIRNKVTGAADTVLSSYNTVLNFKAILARLDFSYGDKRTLFTLEQEMSTLKQGPRGIIEFYDEVEKRLTLIINKVIMTNEGNAPLIESLNAKYRQDALRVFISGLRRPMCDILFSCKPQDMPSALALAQELETNHVRYNFATTYWNNSRQSLPSPHHQHARNHPHLRQVGQMGHHSDNTRNQTGPQGRDMQTHNVGRRSDRIQRPEPMEVDRSMRSVQREMERNNPQAVKRSMESSRQYLPAAKAQRVNQMTHEWEGSNGSEEVDLEVGSVFDEHENDSECYEVEEVNFLGIVPSSRM